MKAKFNIKIDTNNWRNLKYKFILGSLLFKEVQKEEINKGLDIKEVNDAICQAFKNMLQDNSTISASLKYIKNMGTKLYNQKSKNKYTFHNLTDELISNYENQAKLIINNYTDSELIEKLFSNDEFWSNNLKSRNSIIKLFYEEYIKWRSNFSKCIVDKITPKWSDYKHKIMEKLSEEYDTHVGMITMHYFEALCKEIEDNFPNGYVFYI